MVVPKYWIANPKYRASRYDEILKVVSKKMPNNAVLSYILIVLLVVLGLAFSHGMMWNDASCDSCQFLTPS